MRGADDINFIGKLFFIKKSAELRELVSGFCFGNRRPEYVEMPPKQITSDTKNAPILVKMLIK